ncbi:non-ribosomal peptide synthetase [Streptomyces sp. NBC_00190]|uniref:non-ribosomal peptide synthetase n=1 Tax=Streptomyces sp. NBC_00190 TaxID=2903634 RepID=UPI002E2D17C1|nr:non-ribosomal peptide synthetase [Streptomyces sp. NBC_00190]
MQALAVTDGAETSDIARWNSTTTTYPRDCSLPQLFAERLSEGPDRPALTYGGTTLSYRQLDRATNSLARRLLHVGVGRETRVAVHIDRQAAAIVAILAIVKAGGAYLPLDPSHPEARLRLILRDARAALVLTTDEPDPETAFGLPWEPVLGHLAGAVTEDPVYDTPVPAVTGPESLAYVMYTSGSTGAPKGVCVTHRNIARLVLGTGYVSFEPGDRVAQISNIAFDAATFEIWGALLGGCHLWGLDRGTVLDPAALRSALTAQPVRTMVMATPLFNRLAALDPSIFAPVSQLYVGGDVLGPRQACAVAAGAATRLFNGYGPTESTTFATAYAVTGSEGESRLPIGSPIANTRIHILDDQLRPQPVGLPGQIHIGGDGVCRGYHGRPGPTAERFLPDPFSDRPGARMYATGDVGRWTVDGVVEFLGRTDFQVKVRGYRVEPAETDAGLMSHPDVAEAVTVAVGDGTEDRSLVSYYATAGRVVEAPELAGFLRDRLPDHLLPGSLVRLPELPKNANGKIDRSRLPAAERVPGSAPAGGPNGAGQPGADGALPAEGGLTVSQEVAAAMALVLGLDRAAPDENFFELGGHSLSAIRLIAALNDRFGMEVPLPELFDDPTPSGVGRYLEGRLAERGGR